MNLKPSYSLVVLLFLFISLLSSAASASGNSDQTTHLGTIYSEAARLDPYKEFGGYAQTPNNAKYSAISNSLFVLALLKENEIARNDWLQKQATELLQFIKKSFTDIYFDDSNGNAFLSFYDRQYPESHQRTARLARDQALIALAFSKGAAISSDTLIQENYLSLSFETLNYLKRSFGSSNGWEKGHTPYSQSHYANDTSRDVADIAHIIISILEIPIAEQHYASEERQINVDVCIQAANFIDTHARNSDGHIIDKISENGTIISDTVSCRTNALYGIANIRLFEETGNGSFLARAEANLQTIEDLFADIGFPGYIAATADTLSGKRLTDNSLTCLLATLVYKHNAGNLLARRIFAEVAEFLQTTFFNPWVDLDCAVVSRGLLVSDIFSFGSSSYKLWVLSQLPHILTARAPDEIERGSSFAAEIEIFCPLSIELTLNITGPEIKSKIQTFYSSGEEENAQRQQITIVIPETAETGHTRVSVEINYLNRSISAMEFPLSIRSEGILVPRGIIFVIGAGGLGALALLVKYPPRQIKELLEMAVDDQGERDKNAPASKKEN
ncbi:MAG: hypothetical protein ACFFB3_02205 [Candidatus Hodarchaeota archaeon]